MPELPEVETIKLQLKRLLKNKIISSVDLKLLKQVKTPKSIFLKNVVGAKIKNTNRRAKMLIITLNNGNYLIFHLKLTGQLIYHDKEGSSAFYQSKYSHVIFNFKDESKLFFNDLRQFGWVKLVDKKELGKVLSEFGPEPLAKDFTFKKFYDIFSKKKKAIKPLLMEQKFLAGVGNIYAAESCFCAGILPMRRANKINKDEYKKLYQCLKKVLKFAVKKKGSSVENYVDAFGKQGAMTKYLKVYGKASQECKKCGSIIKSIKQNSRTSFYCPKCQS